MLHAGDFCAIVVRMSNNLSIDRPTVYYCKCGWGRQYGHGTPESRTAMLYCQKCRAFVLHRYEGELAQKDDGK